MKIERMTFAEMEKEAFLEALKLKSYEVREKRIHKGKFAETGSLWLCLKYKPKNTSRVYTNQMKIKGRQTAKTKLLLCEIMFQEVKREISRQFPDANFNKTNFLKRLYKWIFRKQALKI